MKFCFFLFLVLSPLQTYTFQRPLPTVLVSTKREKVRLSDSKFSIEDDISGVSVREFSLGYDIQLNRFAGSMGFDEVTDWEYYADNSTNDRSSIVNPPPFDPTKPKRTKTSSGGVVRLYLGELSGPLGAKLRSIGGDNRVLVKEFCGKLALDLAQAELKSLVKLQSSMCEMDMDAEDGIWARSASERSMKARAYGSTREDDMNFVKFYEILTKDKAPFVGIYGGINTKDFSAEMDPNVWFRSFGTKPPSNESVFLVYQYHGLNTLENYSQPAEMKRAKLPPMKGFFGVTPPPPVPAWNKRATYVVQGVLKGCLEAVAFLHDNSIVHRSLGKNSIILSSIGMDKAETASPYAVERSRLKMKISDFGFSGFVYESGKDEDFKSRARSFGVIAEGKTSNSLTGTLSFAFAEDLHALGFIFLGTLLSTLAEVPNEKYTLPSTDEDSLQRLLGEIFKNDMNEFREYCTEEEAWDNVVALLDENDGAGWDLIETMCFARERVAKAKDGAILTARSLLSHPLFAENKVYQ